MHNRALGILATLLSTGAAAEFQTDTGFAVSGDEKIYYESTGSGDAVVLSHGAGGSHAIWMHQVPVLAEHYRVITWDQRGWGKSTDVEGLGGDPNAAVEDLRLLLDHLGVDKAHVIGQSMGGWAVAGFTLRYPDRTRSLTLANTYGGLATEAMRESMIPELVLERQALGRTAHIAEPVRGRAVPSGADDQVSSKRRREHDPKATSSPSTLRAKAAISTCLAVASSSTGRPVLTQTSGSA